MAERGRRFATVVAFPDVIRGAISVLGFLSRRALYSEKSRLET